jgi:hypothetical protein
MLILPPGHAKAVAARRALTARERWMIRGALVTVAVIAVVLVIAFATGGKSSSQGCIYATIPGDVGAQEVNECGTQARDTCATVHAPGAYTLQAADTIAAQCRKAGLPVG